MKEVYNISLRVIFCLIYLLLIAGSFYNYPFKKYDDNSLKGRFMRVVTIIMVVSFTVYVLMYYKGYSSLITDYSLPRTISTSITGFLMCICIVLLICYTLYLIRICASFWIAQPGVCLECDKEDTPNSSCVPYKESITKEHCDTLILDDKQHHTIYNDNIFKSLFGYNNDTMGSIFYWVILIKAYIMLLLPLGGLLLNVGKGTQSLLRSYTCILYSYITCIIVLFVTNYNKYKQSTKLKYTSEGDIIPTQWFFLNNRDFWWSIAITVIYLIILIVLIYVFKGTPISLKVGVLLGVLVIIMATTTAFAVLWDPDRSIDDTLDDILGIII